MSTRAWLLPVSMVLVFAIVWYFLRDPGESAPARPPAMQAASPPPATPGGEPQSTLSATAPAAVPFETLATDTNSADAQRRAAAITALAAAPRAQAVPVLSNVLINGEPTMDRPLALRALRELALAKGDADGAVRSAFRELIYHGDNEALMPATQEALDAVEAAEARHAQR